MCSNISLTSSLWMALSAWLWRYQVKPLIVFISWNIFITATVYIWSPAESRCQPLAFHYSNVKMVPWRFISLASRWFAWAFVQGQIDENIKAPRHRDRWIPFVRGSNAELCFHWMASSFLEMLRTFLETVAADNDIQLTHTNKLIEA